MEQAELVDVRVHPVVEQEAVAELTELPEADEVEGRPTHSVDEDDGRPFSPDPVAGAMPVDLRNVRPKTPKQRCGRHAGNRIL